MGFCGPLFCLLPGFSWVPINLLCSLLRSSFKYVTLEHLKALWGSSSATTGPASGLPLRASASWDLVPSHLPPRLPSSSSFASVVPAPKVGDVCLYLHHVARSPSLLPVTVQVGSRVGSAQVCGRGPAHFSALNTFMPLFSQHFSSLPILSTPLLPHLPFLPSYLLPGPSCSSPCPVQMEKLLPPAVALEQWYQEMMAGLGTGPAGVSPRSSPPPLPAKACRQLQVTPTSRWPLPISAPLWSMGESSATPTSLLCPLRW